MKRSLRALAAIAVVASISVGYSADEGTKLLRLKVLYAGVPDAARTKDFVTFLRGAFAEVGVADSGSLSMDAARAFDVVIVDSPDDANQIDEHRFAELGRGFTKPTILTGTAALPVLQALDIKLNAL